MVKLSPVPDGKLVAYTSYIQVNKNFQFYCATIACHLVLNAESQQLGGGITAETECISAIFFLVLCSK